MAGNDADDDGQLPTDIRAFIEGLHDVHRILVDTLRINRRQSAAGGAEAGAKRRRICAACAFFDAYGMPAFARSRRSLSKRGNLGSDL
jgi:hypothetical protein